VLLLASHADLAWSDLPLTGLFVPLAHRAARYLATGILGASDYRVGTPVYRPTGGTGEREAVVKPPEGEVRTIWPEARDGRAVWAVGSVEGPGVYGIHAGGRLADRFAVQVDPAESDPSPVTTSALQRTFRGARVVSVEADEDLPAAVLANRRGRELWKGFLGAGLLLMLIEGIVAGTERSRKAGATPEPRGRATTDEHR
jgi:hypothetical protein